ncbi:hypothetical protein [Desulfobacca acetoxidans]|uniref:hypothetical protein n=1 Tax=Desulfobacca acetoxidans TaxID=60893 RepID=UPI00059D1A99|nr:hypothetical protein [Desulfobacca acetoxidans]
MIDINEEEQIGKEEESSPVVIPKIDDIKIIQRKIKTLISRMLKNFEISEDNAPIYRPVEKLLAILAVMREVRAQDYSPLYS